ncbi:transposase, partial [Streptomyces albireticuli]
VPIWDNLNIHRAAGMRDFIAVHHWITAFHLLPYTPDLNPVEGICCLLGRRAQTSTAFTDHDHLIRACQPGLRTLQYRSHLIHGCLTGTGLMITNQPTTTPKDQ